MSLQTELYNCYTMPGGTLSHSSSTSSMPICRWLKPNQILSILSHGPRIKGSVEPCWYFSYNENITCNTCHVSRICQLPSMEPHNTLISPCRCLGSIRYVHNPCLAVSASPRLQQRHTWSFFPELFIAEMAGSLLKKDWGASCVRALSVSVHTA